MEKPRRYLGVPVPEVPHGALPSKSILLRRIFSFNNGNMQGFNFSKLHCPFDGNFGMVVCRKAEGCITRREPCLYRTILEPWNPFPIINDISIISKMQRLKKKYDKICKRKEDDEDFLQELETTFNISANNFQEIVSNDSSLSPLERREHVDVLLDYIGPEATR